jgi:hypothetical protein
MVIPPAPAVTFALIAKDPVEPEVTDTALPASSGDPEDVTLPEETRVKLSPAVIEPVPMLTPAPEIVMSVPDVNTAPEFPKAPVPCRVMDASAVRFPVGAIELPPLMDREPPASKAPDPE